MTGDIGTDPAERAEVLAAEVKRLREVVEIGAHAWEVSNRGVTSPGFPPSYPSVTQALRVYTELPRSEHAIPPVSSGHVLAAEVMRLRELTLDVRDDGGMAVYKIVGIDETARVNASELLTEFNRMKAVLARIESLAADWIARGYISDMTYEYAGYSLQEALKGEP